VKQLISFSCNFFKDGKTLLSSEFKQNTNVFCFKKRYDVFCSAFCWYLAHTWHILLYQYTVSFMVTEISFKILLVLIFLCTLRKFVHLSNLADTKCTTLPSEWCIVMVMGSVTITTLSSTNTCAQRLNNQKQNLMLTLIVTLTLLLNSTQ